MQSAMALEHLTIYSCYHKFVCSYETERFVTLFSKFVLWSCQFNVVRSKRLHYIIPFILISLFHFYVSQAVCSLKVFQTKYCRNVHILLFYIQVFLCHNFIAFVLVVLGEDNYYLLWNFVLSCAILVDHNAWWYCLPRKGKWLGTGC
jgi:hypothetical protein